MPRHISRTLAIAFLIAGLGAVCVGESIGSLKPTGYVNDFAHVLKATAKRQIKNLCARVDRRAHAQIAVVTINSVDGENLERYATELFNHWGIGDKATNRGVMILLVVKDRRYRIEVGLGLESILPDERAAELGRQIVPMLQDNNYSAALNTLTNQIALTIANASGVSLEAEGGEKKSSFRNAKEPALRAL